MPKKSENAKNEWERWGGFGVDLFKNLTFVSDFVPNV